MSIDARELRIGNWVNEEVLGRVPIYSIEQKTAWVTAKGMNTDRSIYEQHYHIDLANLQPIPLSPDILEKCGFVINDRAGNWNSPSHTIYTLSYANFSVGIKEDYIGWYNQSGDDYYSSFYPQIKTLHHLQNLYYSLTNNHLTIEL